MPDLILVDGYNFIHADAVLRDMAERDLGESRDALERLLDAYGQYADVEVILVFDGHLVKQNRGDERMFGRVRTLFTKENETADARIESITAELARSRRVTVVTSDLLEQSVVFQLGAMRMSSAEFSALVRDAFGLEEKIHDRQKRARAAFSSGAEAMRSQLAEWRAPAGGEADPFLPQDPTDRVPSRSPNQKRKTDPRVPHDDASEGTAKTPEIDPEAMVRAMVTGDGPTPKRKAQKSARRFPGSSIGQGRSKRHRKKRKKA